MKWSLTWLEMAGATAALTQLMPTSMWWWISVKEWERRLTVPAVTAAHQCILNASCAFAAAEDAVVDGFYIGPFLCTFVLAAHSQQTADQAGSHF
jgi:hypothetical protein